MFAKKKKSKENLIKGEWTSVCQRVKIDIIEKGEKLATSMPNIGFA